MAIKIAHDRLKTLLDYDPETGIFTRKITTSNRSPAGAEAGSVTRTGYRTICVDRVDYQAHRLAWFYMTGSWPENEIDHINHQTLDNRWANLRSASITENRQNAVTRSDNTSGVKGVSWCKRERLWRARVHKAGKEVVIGYFRDLEEAKTAVYSARESLHGVFACHGA